MKYPSDDDLPESGRPFVDEIDSSRKAQRTRLQQDWIDATRAVRNARDRLRLAEDVASRTKIRLRRHDLWSKAEDLRKELAEVEREAGGLKA